DHCLRCWSRKWCIAWASPMASSPSIRAVSPSGGSIRSGSNANGVAIGAKSTTARAVSSWATLLMRSMPCSTSGCSSRRRGHAMRNGARPATSHPRCVTKRARSNVWRCSTRGVRYVLGVPCTTTMRALDALPPAYQGRGRRPKPPWQSVTAWRQALDPSAWRTFTVRDGEKGPVAIEMVKCRVQMRLERERTGPEEWLVITRRPLTDDRPLEARASRDATDHDTRYRYHYYLTPTHGASVAFQEPSLAEPARVIKAGTSTEPRF